MISHQLVQELKDEGFKKPEKYRGMNTCTPCKDHLDTIGEGCEACNWVYEPTLEELIEACGEGFGKLETSHAFGKTQFIALEAHPQTITIMSYVESPTEAVAKLWLALNKNPHAN